MRVDSSNGEIGTATLRFFLRSRNRLRVLCRLSESPATKTELHQDLSETRSTVRRLVSELEELGWVSSVGLTCHMVIPPPLVVESVKSTIGDVDMATRLTGFIGAFPADARPDYGDLPTRSEMSNMDDRPPVTQTDADGYIAV